MVDLAAAGPVPVANGIGWAGPFAQLPPAVLPTGEPVDYPGYGSYDYPVPTPDQPVAPIPDQYPVSIPPAFAALEPVGFSELEPVGFEALEPVGFEELEPVCFAALEPVGFEALEPVGFDALESVDFEAPEQVGFPGLEPVGFVPLEPVGQLAYALVFDTGQRLLVEGPGLIGRGPQALDPRLTCVPIADPERSVSKVHLEYALDKTGVWVKDRASTNGSTLMRVGEPTRNLVPGEFVLLQGGDRVTFGSRYLRLEEVMLS
jgi:hypothetical protein